MDRVLTCYAMACCVCSAHKARPLHTGHIVEGLFHDIPRSFFVLSARPVFVATCSLLCVHHEACCIESPTTSLFFQFKQTKDSNPGRTRLYGVKLRCCGKAFQAMTDVRPSVSDDAQQKAAKQQGSYDVNKGLLANTAQGGKASAPVNAQAAHQVLT